MKGKTWNKTYDLGIPDEFIRQAREITTSQECWQIPCW
jgi:hypothetical protein